MARLPLFPLNTVLFPGCALPLRIFEPRYREMLRSCLDGDRRMGIVLIKSGKEVGGAADPYAIGTVARIGDIGEPDGGAIPLVVTGERRFRISALDRSMAYLIGDVELLDETADPEAETAAKELLGFVARYLRLLYTANGEFRGKINLSGDPLALVSVAGSLLADHPAAIRQTILEAEPFSSRLRLMARALATSVNLAEATLMRAGPGRERTIFGMN